MIHDVLCAQLATCCSWEVGAAGLVRPEIASQVTKMNVEMGIVPFIYIFGVANITADFTMKCLTFPTTAPARLLYVVCN